jgi:hypothetical protein
MQKRTYLTILAVLLRATSLSGSVVCRRRKLVAEQSGVEDFHPALRFYTCLGSNKSWPPGKMTQRRNNKVQSDEV